MNEDRARDAVDHLQSAAREVGAAVRAFIDAIGDADVGRSWAGLFDEITKGFAPEGEKSTDAGGENGEPDDPDDGDYQRIHVD